MRRLRPAGVAGALVRRSPSSRLGGSALAYFSTSGAGTASTRRRPASPTDDHRRHPRGRGHGGADLERRQPRPAPAPSPTTSPATAAKPDGTCPSAGAADRSHHLHRHRPRDRHPHLHGDRGLALLDREKLAVLGDVTIGPATHFTISAATTTPAVGAARQPHDHRQGRHREHRHHLHRLALAGLLRRLLEPGRNRPDGRQQLRHRDHLRRRDRDHLHHRGRHCHLLEERRDEDLQGRRGERRRQRRVADHDHAARR